MSLNSRLPSHIAVGGGLLILSLFYYLLPRVSRSQASDRNVKADDEVGPQYMINRKPLCEQLQTPPDNVITILQGAASSSHCLKIYEPGNLRSPRIVLYRDLYNTVQANATRLQMLPGWKPGRICLLLLDQHYNNIQWFWSVLVAGGIPTLCPPYKTEELQSNLQHLKNLLSNPLCITTKGILETDLGALGCLEAYAIEHLDGGETPSPHSLPREHSFDPMASIAAIMLTSGSSGNSKAVPLSHRQIFSCVSGKSHVYSQEPGGTVLNWVGLDHVAGLLEAHIRALWAGADQVHVEASDIMSSPLKFLELLSINKVSASFAPHFFLARIVDGIEAKHFRLPQTLDLHYLRTIVSGGEACSTDVCLRFSRLLERYGAPKNVVVPGFGMTETGAGCIYSRTCPDSDLKENYEFTSVGRCVPGVKMRLTSLVPSDGSQNQTIGELEVGGPIVFRGYLNNDEANKESFTPDGWFRTGDMGFIDRQGNLVLTGRSKDVICINGVKYLPVDQERIIENARIPGVTPDHIVCFAWRPDGAHTEQCCIIYQHSYHVDDKKARATAQKMITKVFLLSTGARPYVLALPPGVLQKSTLGKISRKKVSIAFEQGAFAEEDALNMAIVQEANKAENVRPNGPGEEAILNIITSTLHLEPSEFSVLSDYFDMGMTSIDLLQIRSKICRYFHTTDLSVEIFIKHNTVRSLNAAIMNLSDNKNSSYDPVVPLKSTGSRAPLWLVHPGVGEVLVFVGLSHHIRDRPVFALRARGLEEEDNLFDSIDEIVTTYVEAIKSRQPRGPYAIAGYSYGSMLAFEITKRLEAVGESVPFLGCLNLPPHIKHRMRQLNLQNCFIHLAMFLRLINDEQATSIQHQAMHLPLELLIDFVLSRSDQARIQELDLTRKGLIRWTHVAYNLQSLAVDYEPTGDVQNMDVFYCDPLAAVARSKQEWLDEKLSQWSGFCRAAPKFHSVNGAHYTMLSSTYVRTFHNTLEQALTDRGV